MKRIFFFCAAMLTMLTCNAQSVQVLRNGEQIAEYDFDGLEIVFKEKEQESDNSDEYVDLGLPSGTLWATRNIGANTPEEKGDYFAWGEVETKSYYNWDNYKWCIGYDIYNKYVTPECSSHNNSFEDGKRELDLEDDAAYVIWGENWRIPSIADYGELINPEYTTCIIEDYNGTLILKVTSKINGKVVIFPAAGSYCNAHSYYDFGMYWCREVITTEGIWCSCGGEFLFTNHYKEPLITEKTGSGNRWKGNTIRPVRRL